jgi:hypothetical protein
MKELGIILNGGFGQEKFLNQVSKFLNQERARMSKMRHFLVNIDLLSFEE